jgi:hypothetical protein
MHNHPVRMTLFTEVFPVAPEAMPSILAWRLDGRGDMATMGGKLSYRLRKDLGGRWVWSSFRLWCDFDADPKKVTTVISTMWKEFPNSALPAFACDDSLQRSHRASRAETHQAEESGREHSVLAVSWIGR